MNGGGQIDKNKRNVGRNQEEKEEGKRASAVKLIGREES